MINLKSSLIAPSLALLLCTNIYASESYTVTGMSLKDALQKISKESNLSYFADESLIKGKTSQNIKNVEGIDQALQAILKGTGLEAIIEDNTIVIREKKVSGSKATLGDVDVVASKDDKYFQLNRESSTGSKLGLTLRETPASIEVLDSEVMLERGITDVTSALVKSTGITGGSSGHGPGGRFSVRGFAGVPGITFLNDGIKLNGSAFSKRAFETANIDKIEVIRGAASVLHGEGSSGANINLISKQPNLVEEHKEFGLRLGSYESYRANFGIGGIAIEDTLAYRIDISSREKGSNFDEEKKTVESLSLGLLYKIEDNLFTSLSINKIKDEGENVYIGTPLINGKLDKSVKEINYNPYTDGIDKGNNLFIKQNIEWYPTTSLELKNQFYYQKIDSEARRPYKVVQSTSNLDKVVIAGADLAQKQDLVGNRLDLIHRGNILGLKNQLLIGTDISKINFKRDMSAVWNSIETNMYNPQKGTFGQLNGSYRVKEVDVDISQVGLYIEDQLSLTEKLTMVSGLRYDHINVNWNYFQSNTKKDRNYKEFSYRLGAVYNFSDITTLYGAYSNSIESGGTSISELRVNQTDLDLTEAEQYEIGLRQSFWEDKAELSTSIYKIIKTNLFVKDADNPGKILNAGKQSSQGVEISIGIQPIERLRIDANLAYVDSKYDEFINGANNYSENTPDSVPKYIANLGFRYMPTANLGMGAWFNHVDSFYADDANTIELPSYTTADVTLDYTYNNTTFSFVVKNITDELYATSGKNRPDVFLGDARNYEFGIKYKF